jgi:hypothetical protein
LGGTFNEPGEGSIEVDHFSAFGLLGKKMSYYAFSTYYIPKEVNVYEAHITVTPNLELCQREVKRKYEGKEEGKSVSTQIQDEEISLDIQPSVGYPDKAWEKDGWKLTPLKAKLQRSSLYKPGEDEVPHFAILLELNNTSSPQCLEQQVGFRGAEPHILKISRDPRTEDDTKTTHASTPAASHDTQPTSTSSPTGHRTGKLGQEAPGQVSGKERGRNTPQYQVVQSSMEHITRALKATPDATKTLTLKFKQKGWIDPTTDCSEDQLITCAMGKIENDSSTFQDFVAMLSDTAGLQDVVNRTSDLH